MNDSQIFVLGEGRNYAVADTSQEAIRTMIIENESIESLARGLQIPASDFYDVGLQSVETLRCREHRDVGDIPSALGVILTRLMKRASSRGVDVLVGSCNIEDYQKIDVCYKFIARRDNQ